MLIQLASQKHLASITVHELDAHRLLFLLPIPLYIHSTSVGHTHRSHTFCRRCQQNNQHKKVRDEPHSLVSQLTIGQLSNMFSLGFYLTSLYICIIYICRYIYIQGIIYVDIESIYNLQLCELHNNMYVPHTQLRIFIVCYVNICLLILLPTSEELQPRLVKAILPAPNQNMLLHHYSLQVEIF